MLKAWAVGICDELEPEFDALPEEALKEARHANLKELRFTPAGGKWRRNHGCERK